MTNKERQESIDKKYSNGKAKRGSGWWCCMCKHRMPKAGCRLKKEKATEDCTCAKSYNRLYRSSKR